MSSLRFNDLEIDFTTHFQGKWDDHDSGAHQNGAFFRPLPDQPGFYPLGDLVVSGDRDYTYQDATNRFAIAVVKDLSGNALRPPAGYVETWNDKGSGAEFDGSMWQPVPPPGYVAMGLVCNSGYWAPSTDAIRCVRQDLAAVGYVGDPVYNDGGSGASRDFGCWRVDPPTSNDGEICFSPGTVVGIGGYGKPARHDSAWVLRVPIGEQAQAPGAALRRPILHSLDRPSPFENDTVHYTTSLPWFAVKDTALSDIDKLRLSPTYRLEREDRYILADHGYNDTSETQRRTYTYSEGVSKSVTDTFSHTTGIELAMEYKIGDSFKVSAKLSYSFTYSRATTDAWSKEVSRTSEVVVPSGVAVALYTVQSRYRLFRADGTQVGNTLDFQVPESLYWTQYPPRAAQATVSAVSTVGAGAH